MSPPLNGSEHRVLDFLNARLPIGWEIYVQSPLNGLRPDFVILHPLVGVGVIEVKNWNIKSGRFVRIDHHVRGDTDLFYNFSGRRIDMARSNPIEQIERYRNGILDLYCPRLGRNGVQVVFGAAIFTQATKADAEKLLQPWIYHATRKGNYGRNCIVSGADEIGRGDLESCVPWAKPASRSAHPGLFTEEMAADLRSWLEESDYVREARQPLKLNERQIDLVEKRSTRIRTQGPAGSGKSVLVVARAARLVREGKRVAVLTFNLSLVPYLRSLAYRVPDAPRNLRQKVIWLSFHLWIRRVCEDAGAMRDYRAIWAQRPGAQADENAPTEGATLKVALAQLIPLLVVVLKRPAAAKVKFDAILVDEGQDFDPAWIAALTGALREHGELLLARDVTQDLYDNAEKQTEPAWSGCGFRGPWGSLKTCYRIPLPAQEKLRELCVRFMGTLENEPPEQQLEFAVMTPCELRWVQCGIGNLAVAALEEIDRMVMKINADPVVYPDVVVLTADEQAGCEIGDLLSVRGIHATDTFTRGEREAARRAKMAFHLSNARVKLTTIHSFKGMEARALVVVLPPKETNLEPKLLYTALSRLLATERGSYLTVVSMAHEYVEFGRSWPDYSERKASDEEKRFLLNRIFPHTAQASPAAP